MSFQVKLGALGAQVIDAADAQRAAIAAAQRAHLRQDVLAIVTGPDGAVSRWTVRHVEYHYARPA